MKKQGKLKGYQANNEVIIMARSMNDYTQQLHEEIEQTPEEYRPLLLKIVHSFREGVMLPSAQDSFIEGWQDAMNNQTQPVDNLWDDIDTH